MLTSSCMQLQHMYAVSHRRKPAQKFEGTRTGLSPSNKSKFLKVVTTPPLCTLKFLNTVEATHNELCNQVNSLTETVATYHHGMPLLLLQPHLGWLYSSDVRAPAIHSTG